MTACRCTPLHALRLQSGHGLAMGHGRVSPSEQRIMMSCVRTAHCWKHHRLGDFQSWITADWPGGRRDIERIAWPLATHRFRWVRWPETDGDTRRRSRQRKEEWMRWMGPAERAGWVDARWTCGGGVFIAWLNDSLCYCTGYISGV
jgi:hypothetical protein